MNTTAFQQPVSPAMQSPAGSLPLLVLERPMAVLIRKGHDEPVLAQVALARADLVDAASETWREACLRTGHQGVPLAETSMRVRARFADPTETRCLGFTMEATLPGGRVIGRDFTIAALRHVAGRVARPLFEAEVLKPGDPYVYEVAAVGGCGAEDRPDANGVSLNVSIRSPSLTYLTIPIRRLLERATPVAVLDPEEFPVFYTPDALARAESCARRGRDAEPPVETGGVLLGSLAVCPDSGELAAIVTEVIEVQDAEQTAFSLSYSSRSWLRIQAILKVRQAAYPQRAERLLGQAHGHSFTPSDGRVCAECEKRASCNLTSVFVSPDDQNWHRAVFARQPWALCHIFGLTARAEGVHQLYGLRDGRLQPRGYYLLPDSLLP